MGEGIPPPLTYLYRAFIVLLGIKINRTRRVLQKKKHDYYVCNDNQCSILKTLDNEQRNTWNANMQTPY